MKRNELIEVVAQTFCGLDGGPPFDKRAKDKAERRFLGLSCDSQDEVFDDANTILTAIESAGFRVVPYEPTKRMVDSIIGNYPDDVKAILDENVRADFKAMLDAEKAGE